LRLLIDEMYPAAIAEQLRRRGHDASTVTESAELRSQADSAIFALAQRERRAVVTENVSDFIPLADDADQRDQPHHGLVLVDPAKYRRGSRRTIGRLVTALDRLLAAVPDDEARSLRDWL
jgi:Domain of unknown function (DUF5615)